MKRRSYSLYFVPSVFHGREVMVSDQLTSMLIAWAETTPRVCGFQPGTPTFVYDGDDGKPKETKVSLSVSMANGQRAYWDGCRSELRDKRAKSLAVKEGHARVSGADYRLFSEDILDPSSVERRNRIAAHQMLFLGRRLDTDALETELLLGLVEGPQTLGRFTAASAVSSQVATLAVLRAYLKGRVAIPLQSEPVGGNWVIQRASP